jgi:FkbM family methyltransferase
MFDDLKTRSHRFLARHRRRAPVQALHRFASFIEECYENDEWDMFANGETSLQHRLRHTRVNTIFDVGAHVGDWSVEALRTWPGAHVHAFEVAPPTFARLQAHIERAGLSDRSTLNCEGLGAAAGTREMYYFPEHPNLTCDRPRHPHSRTIFTAQIESGDAYVERHGIDAIDFLKIDVEGAEHLVLDGFARTIAGGRVRCIQFEYGAFSIDTRVLLADYYERLADNYWIGKIYPSHVEFADYQWTMETFRFANFLCVLRTRPDLKALAEAPVARAGTLPARQAQTA